MKTEWTTEYARSHIYPTSDLFARYLFSSPKKEHLTLSFINAVLEDAKKPLVSSVKILSPFNLKKYVYDKESIMDLKVEEPNGKKYDVEIQTTSSDSFWNRMTYYNNNIYNDQIGESDEYKQLNSTTVIALLQNHIYNRKSPVMEFDKLHHFSLVVHEDCHDEVYYPNGDPEKFHILELDRFDFNEEALYNVDSKTRRKIGTRLFHWLRFLRDGARSNFMDQYNETDVDIKEAKEAYEGFISDYELRDAQLRHQMWLHDQAQAKYDAREEGLEEGREEGREIGSKQKAIETARNMKQHSIPTQVIAECTGLSLDEVTRA